jgi:hypothetical protein
MVVPLAPAAERCGTRRVASISRAMVATCAEMAAAAAEEQETERLEVVVGTGCARGERKVRSVRSRLTCSCAVAGGEAEDGSEAEVALLGLASR